MTANEAARRRLSAILWLSCLVLLHLGVVLWGLLPAAFFGQMLLLGWWVAVSRARIPWKLAGYCLGMTVILVLVSRSYVSAPSREIPWTRFDWLIFPFLVGPIMEAPITLLLFLATARHPRRWRAHLATPFGTDPSKQGGGTWQWTLADLLLLTFALAATLGLLLWTAPYPTWLLELPKIWLVVFSNITSASVYSLQALGGVLATLTAAWLVLGTGRLRWRLLVIVPVLLWPPASTALIVTIGWEDSTFPGLTSFAVFVDTLPSEYRLTLSLFAALTVSFVIVRLAGYRLHCGTRETQGQE